MPRTLPELFVQHLLFPTQPSKHLMYTEHHPRKPHPKCYQCHQCSRVEFTDTYNTSFALGGRRCAEHRAQERREHALPHVRASRSEEHDTADEVSVAGEEGRVPYDAVWTGGDELMPRLDRDLEAKVVP